jgi:hypothetical protein
MKSMRQPLSVSVHLKADQRHWGLLRAYGERPGYGSTTKKCDEVLSPHGFAHAEDTVGYIKVELQQGFALGEMGFRGQCAGQQF